MKISFPMVRLAGAVGIAAVAIVAGASLVGAGAPQRDTEVPAPLRPQVWDYCCDSFENTVNLANYWAWTGHYNPPAARWQQRAATQQWGKAHTGDYAMWFGDPATGEFGGEGCDTCTVYSGTLTSLYAIPLPTTEEYMYLMFWSWERTEMSIPTLECYQQVTCTFDSRQVWVSGTVHTNWQLVWDTRVTPTVENLWHKVVIDISAFKGEDVRVRFKFDTIDGRNNDASNLPPAGWFVDDLQFFGFTPVATVYLPLMNKSKSGP